MLYQPRIDLQVLPFSIIPPPDIVVVFEKVYLPHFLPDALWIVSKKLVPSSEMQRYSSLHFRWRLIVRIVDDSPFHTAKNSFDDIQELRIRWERDKGNVRAAAAGTVPCVNSVGPLN